MDTFLSVGMPLYFFCLDPNSALMGDWCKADIVGEFNESWIVRHNTNEFLVSKQSLTSERISFYPAICKENEPRGYHCMHESLKEYFRTSSYNRLPYEVLRRIFESVLLVERNKNNGNGF